MKPPLAAWGLGGTPEPLPGGHRNTVLRVGSHVLKSTRRSEEAINWLLPVLDAAEASGFRVARPDRSATGAFVVHGWTCEPFLPGAPTDLHGVAPLIDGFRRRAAQVGQRPGFASASALIFRQTGGDIDLTDMPMALVDAFRAAWAPLLDLPHGVVHGDLNPGNVLRDADGQLALIDWDEARHDAVCLDDVPLGRADDIAERAAQAWETACCWQIEPERARSLAAPFLRGLTG